MIMPEVLSKSPVNKKVVYLHSKFAVISNISTVWYGHSVLSRCEIYCSKPNIACHVICDTHLSGVLHWSRTKNSVTAGYSCASG